MNPSAENSRRWIVALSRLPDGAARDLATESDVFADDKRYAIRINDEFTVDVLPAVAGLTWEQMSPHVTDVELDGVTLRLLDLPGLLKTKRGARPKFDCCALAAPAPSSPRLTRDTFLICNAASQTRMPVWTDPAMALLVSFPWLRRDQRSLAREKRPSHGNGRTDDRH